MAPLIARSASPPTHPFSIPKALEWALEGLFLLTAGLCPDELTLACPFGADAPRSAGSRACGACAFVYLKPANRRSSSSFSMAILTPQRVGFWCTPEWPFAQKKLHPPTWKDRHCFSEIKAKAPSSGRGLCFSGYDNPKLRWFPAPVPRPPVPGRRSLPA